ncbi:Ig-like protein [Staphylococcus phage vB_SauM_JDF86]|nr:Ig-like protein [Staphylococcus phage vB_SauM_JDF86]
MAKEVLKDVIFQNETVDINNKYLEVKTIADGYTGTHNGVYSYKVVQEGEEYFVYPVETDGKGTLITRKKSPIIYTDGDIVYFVVSTVTEPYEHPVIREEDIKGLDKAKQVLQAFLAFAYDNFTLGVYNVFFTNTEDAFGVKDSSDQDAENFEDSDTASARAREERFAWGSTRTETRPYPEGVAESVAKEEKEIEAPKEPENVEVAPQENEAEVSAE